MLARLSTLTHWQIDALVTGLLLQGAVFATIPEEIVILSLGVLWGRGQVSYAEAMLAVQIGVLPANLAMVFYGRWIGAGFSGLKKRGWILRLFPHERAQAHVERLKESAHWVIFTTRLTPLVRGPVYFAAGASGIRPIDFFRWDILASCLQIPLLLCLGRWMGRAFF